MATTTENLGLKNPSYDEMADIGVINDNMEIIDKAYGDLKGDLVDFQEKTLYKEYVSLGKNGTGSDNPTHYGYGVPINKTIIRKVQVKVMANQSSPLENVTLKCQIKNKNGVLLGEKECTVYAKHYQDSIYEFIFDSDIVIDTDYGWLYVISEKYPIGYCTVTRTDINKDIVYDYQNNNVTGKYMDVLNGDWWDFNTDQSYQFNLCFELFYFDYNGSIPLRNEERITKNEERITKLVDLQEKTLYKEYVSLGKNGTGSDNPTFYGYGVPINKTIIRKVQVTIMTEQSSAQENVTLKCQIKNNNDELLGETECTVYAQHYHDSIYEFIFDDDIAINTDYGWLYVFSENYKLGYCTVTTTNINKDIVYDYQTNNVKGKCIDVLNGDWWDFNTDQSYQFNLCFELFYFDYNGSIPLRNEERITKNEERITKIEGKIVNDTVITVSNATELKETLDSIATSVSNNKANAKNRYTIQLNSGTYDMYSICKKSGYVDQEKFNRGIEIPDYVSLVGIGNVILECNIPDSDNTSDYLPSRIISVINAYGENSFENINFVATNCRYCVHDDNGGDYKYRTISFKNCTFKHNGVSNADVWPSPECYGAGYTAGRKGIFENCTFESDFLPFYIHSSPQYYMTDKFEVSIKNCAFITTYENAIDLQDAYGTDLQGVAHIDNCYLTGKIRLSGSKPWTIYGGGNSNVEVSNENNSKIYLVNSGGLTESQVNNLIDAKLTGVETLLGGGF